LFLNKEDPESFEDVDSSDEEDDKMRSTLIKKTIRKVIVLGGNADKKKFPLDIVKSGSGGLFI
jgi:hypothetical protein